MNIGIFIRNISPEDGGGFTFQETVISTLAKKTIAHSITIFHYGPSIKYKGQTNVKYRSLGSRALRRIHLLVGGGLDYQAKKNKIDIILFPAPDFEPIDLPFISTIWDLEHRAQPYFPELSIKGEWRRREKLFSKSLPRASYVITGTDVGKKEISTFYGVAPERIRILPHPTPSFALHASPQAGKTNLVSEPYVLYPAQFWAHKNHFHLIQALKILKDKGVTINLALVGSDKGNLGYIKSQVEELGLKGQVKFLGFVSRDELISLYRNALALVYTSVAGPENLPPLEAFALGCPVIAADIPGSREQLGDHALLVNALAPTEIADAIELVLNDKTKRKSLIDMGKVRAQSYTNEHFVNDLLGIFEEFQKINSMWKHKGKV